MDIKLEGRQVDIGADLHERIHSRFAGLDKRFGPITYARVSIEKKPHLNEGRAEVKMVANVTGSTITATRDADTVMQAVNDALDTLTEELTAHVEKKKKNHR
ncbi:MAG: HPF/RaiA family ribosome-associated protein [Magnetococcus sp. WYHC-3]